MLSSCNLGSASQSTYNDVDVTSDSQGHVNLTGSPYFPDPDEIDFICHAYLELLDIN